MRNTSSIFIDLAAVDRNISSIRQVLSPDCGLCAVVKADGYGLGAAKIARQLAASGVAMLAVYNLSQAEAIAASGVTLPILVLMPVREVEVGGPIHRLLIAGRLHLVAHGYAHAQELASLSEQLGGGPIPVHLEVDTGMGRGGAVVGEVSRTLAAIADDRRLRLAGVFTHFSDSRCDETRTQMQMEEFDAVLDANRANLPVDVIVHAANSHAMLRSSRYHRTMVRSGLAWTGLVDDSDDSSGVHLLDPILSWESSIVHVKEIPAGAPVGYGSLWRSDRPTRLAVIPVGYFDGYPVIGAKSPERFVRIMAQTSEGTRSWDAPVVGAVNMDQIVVDITRVEGSLSYGDGYIGMGAQLFGNDRARPNFLPRLAEAVGAHPYELLCRLNSRIPRIYLGESASLRANEAAATEPRTQSAMTA